MGGGREEREEESVMVVVSGGSGEERREESPREDKRTGGGNRVRARTKGPTQPTGLLLSIHVVFSSIWPALSYSVCILYISYIYLSSR